VRLLVGLSSAALLAVLSACCRPAPRCECRPLGMAPPVLPLSPGSSPIRAAPLPIAVFEITRVENLRVDEALLAAGIGARADFASLRAIAADDSGGLFGVTTEGEVLRVRFGASPIKVGVVCRVENAGSPVPLTSVDSSGSGVVVGSWESLAFFVDVPSGQYRAVELVKDSGAMVDLASASPKGAVFSLSRGPIFSVDKDTLALRSLRNDGVARYVASSHRGDFLLLPWAEERSAELLNVDGTSLSQLPARDDNRYIGAVSDTGNTAAMARQESVVTIWRPQAGDVFNYESEEGGHCRALAFLGITDRLLVVWDTGVDVIDGASGRRLAAWRGPDFLPPSWGAGPIVAVAESGREFYVIDLRRGMSAFRISQPLR
jgi:hypothetical protein